MARRNHKYNFGDWFAAIMVLLIGLFIIAWFWDKFFTRADTRYEACVDRGTAHMQAIGS